ncbi:MAG: ubiquinol-cytochrome c reductase iron-sulfur subunit [Chloroflexi bacterium]|nr:ubiquinol-cytochrome c reductase iron-sulfur subunit [Chloroflexota bacterium]
MKEITRRRFLTLLAGAGVGIPAAVLAALGYRFMKPNVNYGRDLAFTAGRAQDFPVGSARVFPDRRVIVVSRESGLFAMSMICTHLGCTVNTMEWGFQSPCHGSRFDLDGLVLRGPAPRPLPWYKIEEQVDGKLAVDTSHTVRRGTYFKPDLGV